MLSKIQQRIHPKIFVISGPGGAGKTTLFNQLFRLPHIQNAFIRGITVTTRKKRPGEKDGQDYFFVDKEEFLRLEQKKFFLESQKILDNYYGTPGLFYTLAKIKNKDLILCIDVKGGMYLKRKFKPDRIITIFIDVPTTKELYTRMQKREETRELMQKRVKLAKQELQFAKHYDHFLINKNLRTTLKKLEKIILAKSYKMSV